MTPRITTQNVELSQPATFSFAIGNQHHPPQFASISEGIGDGLQDEQGVIAGSDGTNPSNDFGVVGVAGRQLQREAMVSPEFGFEQSRVKAAGTVFLDKGNIGLAPSKTISMRGHAYDIFDLRHSKSCARLGVRLGVRNHRASSGRGGMHMWGWRRIHRLLPPESALKGRGLGERPLGARLMLHSSAPEPCLQVEAERASAGKSPQPQDYRIGAATVQESSSSSLS